jgi:hypothetical protein
MLTRTRWHTLADAHSLTRTRSHALAYAHSLTRTRWRALADVHSLTRTRWRALADAHSLTRTRWRALAHAALRALKKKWWCAQRQSTLDCHDLTLLCDKVRPKLFFLRFSSLTQGSIIWNGSWPSSSGLRGCRRTYHTIFKLADHALSKMVRYVLDPVTFEAGARRPRSISNDWALCQTRKTPTLGQKMFKICRIVE